MALSRASGRIPAPAQPDPRSDLPAPRGESVTNARLKTTCRERRVSRRTPAGRRIRRKPGRSPLSTTSCENHICRGASTAVPRRPGCASARPRSSAAIRTGGAGAYCRPTEVARRLPSRIQRRIVSALVVHATQRRIAQTTGRFKRAGRIQHPRAHVVGGGEQKERSGSRRNRSAAVPVKVRSAEAGRLLPSRQGHLSRRLHRLP